MARVLYRYMDSEDEAVGHLQSCQSNGGMLNPADRQVMLSVSRPTEDLPKGYGPFIYSMEGFYMSRPTWLKKTIAAGNEFHFVKQTPWKHNLINISSTLLVFGLFGGLMMLGGVLEPWLYIPLATVLMGCLLFSLFVLVIHECSHCMFLLKRDREASKQLNHRVGTIFGNILFTNFMEHWAKEHTVHHLRPMEDVDKQDQLRFSGQTWLKMVGMMLIPGASLFVNPSRQYGFSVVRFLIGLSFFGGAGRIGGHLYSLASRRCGAVVLQHDGSVQHAQNCPRTWLKLESNRRPIPPFADLFLSLALADVPVLHQLPF